MRASERRPEEQRCSGSRDGEGEATSATRAARGKSCLESANFSRHPPCFRALLVSDPIRCLHMLQKWAVQTRVVCSDLVEAPWLVARQASASELLSKQWTRWSLSRSFSRCRATLLVRSSLTPRDTCPHGCTQALFAPCLPQQHQHPGLVHHRQPHPATSQLRRAATGLGCVLLPRSLTGNLT